MTTREISNDILATCDRLLTNNAAMLRKLDRVLIVARVCFDMGYHEIARSLHTALDDDDAAIAHDPAVVPASGVSSGGTSEATESDLRDVARFGGIV